MFHSTSQVLAAYYLSPQSTPTKRLRLVPIPDDEATDPMLSALSTTSPLSLEALLLAKGWQGLSPEQEAQILNIIWPAWHDLSDYQRDCLVVETLGSRVQGNAAPPWSTSLNMARLLLDRVQDDLFSLDDYAHIVYRVVANEQGFGTEEAGLPLLDPRYRARHFLTLLCAASASVLSFAFVAIYQPQALFRSQPATPVLVRFPSAPQAPEALVPEEA